MTKFFQQHGPVGGTAAGNRDHNLMAAHKFQVSNPADLEGYPFAVWTVKVNGPSWHAAVGSTFDCGFERRDALRTEPTSKDTFGNSRVVHQGATSTPLPIAMIATTPIALALVSWHALLSGPASPPKVPAQGRELPQVQVVKGKRKNVALPPIVQGNLLDETGLIPLAIGVVQVGRAVLPADGNGAYRWHGKPGTYVFRARSVGYADVVSQKIRLVRGDSIRLDFRLPIGPPIVHKMPSNQ